MTSTALGALRIRNTRLSHVCYYVFEEDVAMEKGLYWLVLISKTSFRFSCLFLIHASGQLEFSVLWGPLYYHHSYSL